MLSALLRLNIEADLIIIPPDGEASAHLIPLVPGVNDLAPLGAEIAAAVVTVIKTVTIATSLATMPKIAPPDPFALTAGLQTICPGIVHRKKRTTLVSHALMQAESTIIQ